MPGPTSERRCSDWPGGDGRWRRRFVCVGGTESSKGRAVPGGGRAGAAVQLGHSLHRFPRVHLSVQQLRGVMSQHSHKQRGGEQNAHRLSSVGRSNVPQRSESVAASSLLDGPFLERFTAAVSAAAWHRTGGGQQPQAGCVGNAPLIGKLPKALEEAKGGRPRQGCAGESEGAGDGVEERTQRASRQRPEHKAVCGGGPAPLAALFGMSIVVSGRKPHCWSTCRIRSGRAQGNRRDRSWRAAGEKGGGGGGH